MGITNKKTLTKTRRKTRDVEEIAQDLLSPAHLDRYKATKLSEELPGLGRHYCVACARWLETAGALASHQRGKPHRRRLKQLADGVYTQREAEAAIGLHTDSGAQTKLFAKPLAIGPDGDNTADATVAAPQPTAALTAATTTTTEVAMS